MKGVSVVKESCPGGELPSTFPSRKTWKQLKNKTKQKNTGDNATTGKKNWRQGAIFFQKTQRGSFAALSSIA